MIAELYANMCGTELWNRARLARYMANGVRPPRVELACAPCEGLEDLIPCIEDEPPNESGAYPGYQLPELDPAPWYDVLAPESKDFAGMLVLETRLSSSIDRRMVQNIGHGATLTRARYEGRTLTVRGLLVARTCCAAEYGFKWLTQALLGNFCDTCDGCLLTFLTCSPSSVSDSECIMVYDEDGNHIPYFRESEDSELVRGTDFVRQMHGSGLLQGPNVIALRGGGSCSRNCGCASMMEVEFTIGIGNPWMYGLEEEVDLDVELDGCGVEECMVQFDDDPDCDPFSLCRDLTGCDEDPDCADPPTPPPSGLMPLQQCGCLPFVFGRNCFTIPAGRDWFDQALIVEVYAGSEPLRNLAVRMWQNPLGLDCCAPENSEYFSDCNACGTLLVGYVPAFGTLRFDSVAREVVMTCKNVTKPAAKNIATLEGLPFEWFEVGCQPVCISVDIDCANTAVDATASVWRAGREL